jgi:hypothetical protein
MTIRRTAIAFGALSLGLISLTACSKPTAQATVTVGSKSVQAEARPACRTSDDHPLSDASFVACLNDTPKHHITVPVGDQVRIGVDPSIGDKGWLIASDNQLVTPEVLKNKTYWQVDSSSLFVDQQTGAAKPSVTLSVVESKDTTGRDSFRVIQFKLVRGQ